MKLIGSRISNTNNRRIWSNEPYDGYGCSSNNNTLCKQYSCYLHSMVTHLSIRPPTLEQRQREEGSRKCLCSTVAHNLYQLAPLK